MNDKLKNEGAQVDSAVKTIRDEKKHYCQNKMLECINAYPHLSVNGSKDSEYNDLIAFERHFHEWDDNLIVLQKIDYGHEGGEGGRPYAYVTLTGIFDNIGMFARRLQRILPHQGEGLMISVMDFGGDLSINIHDPNKSGIFGQPSYRVKTYQLNQINPQKHEDGMKWHITNP